MSDHCHCTDPAHDGKPCHRKPRQRRKFCSTCIDYHREVTA